MLCVDVNVLVYAANGLPFAIFILAGFFRALPRSLHEAAVMDGCGEWTAFRRVMLPLARPGLVTVAIFQFIGVWKEYFYAFMLTGGDPTGASRTLPLGLANLSITAQYRSDYGSLFAGIVLVTIPILLVYLFLQRHIVKGIAAGALNQFVHHRYERLATFQAEALGTRVLGGQVIFQTFRSRQAFQYVLAHVIAELGRAAYRFETTLQPALLFGIHDVHDFAADGAAVGLLQRLDDLAQRCFINTQEERTCLELGIKISFGQLME